MEEATTIGCLTCFTGTSRSKNEPNSLLIESVSSKLELLPCYEKLPSLSNSYAINMPHEMRRQSSSGGWKRLKWNILGTNFGSAAAGGIDEERKEGAPGPGYNKIVKRSSSSSWLPNANGKRWPVQGWA